MVDDGVGVIAAEMEVFVSSSGIDCKLDVPLVLLSSAFHAVLPLFFGALPSSIAAIVSVKFCNRTSAVK